MVVLTETRGRVRVITLNRPEKRNALNLALCEGLLDAFRAAEADDAIAALVVAGAGLGFSAGADLGERALYAEQPAMQTRRAQAGLDLLAAPVRMGKPVVAAIHGNTIGAGHALALCCDLNIAAEDVRISYPEAKHDIYPSLVLPTLMRHIGPKDCFELLATGRPVLGPEALRRRLVNAVVPKEELLERACAMAEGAALYSQDSLRRIKASINAQGDGVAPSAP